MPHHLSIPKAPRALIYTPAVTLTQHHNLPSGAHARGPATADVEEVPAPFDAHNDIAPLPEITPHHKKRQQQWQRWETEVIPSLIGPYIQLLHQTQSLRENAPEVRYEPCTCGEKGRVLEIMIVRFSGMSSSSSSPPAAFPDSMTTVLERQHIHVCRCIPAATRLVDQGLFPCAPMAPTLAVDMRVLEFVGGLYKRISPNHTAWCNTVEEFLEGQGYKLRTEVRVSFYIYLKRHSCNFHLGLFAPPLWQRPSLVHKSEERHHGAGRRIPGRNSGDH